MVLQSQRSNVSWGVPQTRIFLVAFLLREYFPSQEERVDDIGEFVSPSCTHLLQLVMENEGRKELHLINCPGNILLDEVLTSYLSAVASKPVEQWQINLYGRDKLRFYFLSQLPKVKMANLDYNESLVLVRYNEPENYGGWTQVQEE